MSISTYRLTKLCLTLFDERYSHSNVNIKTFFEHGLKYIMSILLNIMLYISDLNSNCRLPGDSEISTPNKTCWEWCDISLYYHNNIIILKAE